MKQTGIPSQMDTGWNAPEGLDSPDPEVRKKLRARADVCRTALPPPDAPAAGWNNLHAHSVFSFNSYGYTPTGLAWRARQAGLEVAGLVDFDVLDGVDEFIAAGQAFGLKTVAGLETRVFLPELSHCVINSPGEPGIAYHVGLGFPSARIPEEQSPFLARLRQSSSRRNQDIMLRLHSKLLPIRLDYEADVLPLTPAGNATERHLCLAYARKAAAHFDQRKDLAAFWRDRLDLDRDAPDLPDGPGLQGLIRSRLMKRGGLGYVQPDGGSFPLLVETNQFIRNCGAIPTLTWLDGSSEGERSPDALLELAIAAGTAAANIIPDRNFTPGLKDEKLERLDAFITAARRRHIPLVAGTEMNAPGNKFVDDFTTRELAPFLPDFRQGARILFAHAVLQACANLGYLSDWAEEIFKSTEEKNAFFEEAGRLFPADTIKRNFSFPRSPAPDSLLDTARRLAARTGENR